MCPRKQSRGKRMRTFTVAAAIILAATSAVAEENTVTIDDGTVFTTMEGPSNLTATFDAIEGTEFTFEWQCTKNGSDAVVDGNGTFFPGCGQGKLIWLRVMAIDPS